MLPIKTNKGRGIEIRKEDLDGQADLQRPALPTLLFCPSVIQKS